MVVKTKTFTVFAAISGFTAVLLGAFAAHGLKNTLSDYSLDIWKTAVLYQFIHTLLLIHLSSLSHYSKFLAKAQLCLCLGIILFSGSLYILALTGSTILGVVTPIGGVCLLLGWIFFILELTIKNKSI